MLVEGRLTVRCHSSTDTSVEVGTSNRPPREVLFCLVCRRCGLEVSLGQSNEGPTLCQDCSARNDIRVWMDVLRVPIESAAVRIH
jgi:hypothetical protein